MKVWLITFSKYDDWAIRSVCLTEEIAKRELKKVRKEEPIKNYEQGWNYFEYEVITE